MLFDDDFLSTVRDDPVAATIALCERGLGSVNSQSQRWSDSEWEALLEAYSLLVEIIESKILPIHLDYPPLAGALAEDCKIISPYLKNVKEMLEAELTKLRVESLRSKFRTSLSSGFSYEFSQGDLDQIQTLINELRDQITANHQLDKEHQRRLLMRLEKLQAELHKKVSDLDRFWGLIGDAGVVLGKLGNDAKPIVDRVREIADIVWRTQSRAEELPSGTRLPLLEQKKPDGGD